MFTYELVDSILQLRTPCLQFFVDLSQRVELKNQTLGGATCWRYHTQDSAKCTVLCYLLKGKGPLLEYIFLTESLKINIKYTQARTCTHIIKQKQALYTWAKGV